MENGHGFGRLNDDAGHRRLEINQAEQLRSEMQRMHRDLVQRIDLFETNILRAFCGSAESTEKRFNHIDANLIMFMSRLDSLESRVLDVEKRLNIPPTT